MSKNDGFRQVCAGPSPSKAGSTRNWHCGSGSPVILMPPKPPLRSAASNPAMSISPLKTFWTQPMNRRPVGPST